MGEVVNLRQHRKRKEREEREKIAAENRSKYGRTKVEKETGRALTEIDRRRLDGHRRDDDGPDSSTDGA
ncbi:DUF4169 family protein [Mongoliimonas terrestris]|uniref:DUF4169 family protein n=1 Tax=Mongoliimonas terrestris TaxID=1709001 RepID=UPI0009497475|nr:DUF4169 family protein [Mongoliimonas terrestris]